MNWLKNFTFFSMGLLVMLLLNMAVDIKRTATSLPVPVLKSETIKYIDPLKDIDSIVKWQEHVQKHLQSNVMLALEEAVAPYAGKALTIQDVSQFAANAAQRAYILGARRSADGLRPGELPLPNKSPSNSDKPDDAQWSAPAK